MPEIRFIHLIYGWPQFNGLWGKEEVNSHHILLCIFWLRLTSTIYYRMLIFYYFHYIIPIRGSVFFVNKFWNFRQQHLLSLCMYLRLESLIHWVYFWFQQIVSLFFNIVFTNIITDTVLDFISDPTMISFLYSCNSLKTVNIRLVGWTYRYPFTFK